MTSLTPRIKEALNQPWVITALDITFLAVAVASLIYAVATAPQNGIDFLNYYKGAREWLEGVYSNEGGALSIYPPFSVTILSPLALVSFEQARIIWLGINLLATGTCIYLVLCYFNDWPRRAKYYLVLLLVSWAPFRVTLRVGQISLIITAVLLGALVARSRKRMFLAGVLLGLSLCKFTLTLPFVLYFLWKREWKILTVAVSLILILTQIYALRLGLSVVEVVKNYANILGQISGSRDIAYVGSTEIKPLLIWMSRGNDDATNILLALLVVASLIVVAVVFARRPEAEPVHFAILALFALWTVYHRTYDSVLYILPVALLIDFFVHRRFVTFSIFWLVATGLLVISLPGLLTSRMGIGEEMLTQSILGFVAINIERVLTIGMFASLSFVLLKLNSFGPQPEMPNPTQPNDCERA
jgi:hypothetical protein